MNLTVTSETSSVEATGQSKWAFGLCERLQSAINQQLSQKATCSLMLTGGRSAALLYRTWSDLFELPASLRGAQFYFGDERCVLPNHPESIYRLTLDTLFTTGVPNGVQIHRMEADSLDQNAAAVRYEDLLPEFIDVLLLSMGEDGHIASLFPHSPALREPRRQVVPVTGPKPPFQRLTITPPVIKNARQVFVLALGNQKRAMYEEALRDPEDFEAIPARLVLDRTWIFGD